MSASAVSEHLRRIVRDDAILMDDYGVTITAAANAIDLLRRGLDDAVAQLEGLSKAPDSDYARPDPATTAWLLAILEATK